MAGDWIKMRNNLWDDPRVSGMVDATGSSEAAVVGGLYWLWATADQHSDDGRLPGLSLRSLDMKTGIDGFGAALVAAGWVEEVPGALQIIRFGEHNGASAKARAQTAKRVANLASGNKGKPANQGANGDLTGIDDKTNAESVSSALAREDIEKNKNKPPIPPVPGGEEPDQSKTKRRSAIGLKAFFEECRASGEKPIRENDPVFDYAEQTGIPVEYLRLHWLEFKDRYTQTDAKRYKDWRSVYRKSVRGNWFRIWAIRADGACTLTTIGEQAKRAHLEAA